MAEVLFISLIYLIQHPEIHNQKKVRVVGFASLDFERKALYISREDYEHAVTKNAVWLDIDLTESIRKNHKKYVLVEGTFDKDNLGHLKLYSGSITQIDRLELWDREKQ